MTSFKAQKHWLDILAALSSMHMAEDKPKSDLFRFLNFFSFFSINSTDDPNNNNATFNE